MCAPGPYRPGAARAGHRTSRGTMPSLLLPLVLLYLLLAGQSSGSDADIKKENTSTLSANSTIQSSEPTLGTTAANLNVKTTTEMVSDGRNNSVGITIVQPSYMSQQPRDDPLNFTVKEEVGTTRKEGLKGLTKTMAVSPTPIDPVSAVQSSLPKAENQSSVQTTKTPVNTPKPDVPVSKVNILLSTVGTIQQNNSQSPASAENASNTSPSSTSPSYSSVILPVVIALIVITLSVFVLVGFYRICRKTDSGTQENGNDQPQSDKESVKLLTVKTISHESGEHSAQRKGKN